MTANRSVPTSRERAEDSAVDAMIEETFPASDATQLPGRAASPPASRSPRPSTDDETTKQPHTIGNQGVVPASRSTRDDVDLGDAGTVVLRIDGHTRSLHIDIAQTDLVVDAPTLDRLIAALSEKRARMDA